MAKQSQTAKLQANEVRDAKVLKAHHARWIEKRALLRAIINRCEKVSDTISEKLNPYIVAETENDPAHRAVVRVGKRVVEVKVVESERIGWQELCKSVMTEAQIAGVKDGFTNTSISPRAALIGMVSEVISSL